MNLGSNAECSARGGVEPEAAAKIAAPPKEFRMSITQEMVDRLEGKAKVPTQAEIKDAYEAAQAEKTSKRYYRVGDEVRVRHESENVGGGLRFRVKSVKPGELRLKLIQPKSTK